MNNGMPIELEAQACIRIVVPFTVGYPEPPAPPTKTKPPGLARPKREKGEPKQDWQARLEDHQIAQIGAGQEHADRERADQAAYEQACAAHVDAEQEARIAAAVHAETELLARLRAALAGHGAIVDETIEEVRER